MIRINMLSQADSVAGQGVGAAYLELIRLLRTHLVDDFYVTINKYGKSDLTHYHTINPTYFANSFSPARGRKIGYVHFLPDTLEGSIKLPGRDRLLQADGPDRGRQPDLHRQAD